MIYFQDPGADGSAGGGASLENRSAFGYPTRTPQLIVSVYWQRLSGWVGIGEEQSPADTPMELLATGAVFVADFLVLDTVRTAQGVYYDIRDDRYGSATIGVAGIACDVVKACKALDKAFDVAKRVRSSRRAIPREGIYEFPDQRAGGTVYVGQSKDIQRRLREHQAAGRYTPGTESTTEVLGGKTAREVAEYHRIRALTGDVPARRSAAISNQVDPIGPARRHLLE